MNATELEKFLPPRVWGYDGKLHLERMTYAMWRQAHMAHARHLGRHTQAEWEELKARIGKCVSCGNPERLTKDHIRAVSLGGCDCIHNLQPMCQRCNSSKGVR